MKEARQVSKLTVEMMNLKMIALELRNQVKSNQMVLKKEKHLKMTGKKNLAKMSLNAKVHLAFL